jgi:hypothetical protein
MTQTASPDAAAPASPPARPRHRTGIWTAERIQALGAVTDLPTAAAILSLSRTLAYHLARHGRFPVPVLRAGTRYRVPVAPILAALHLPPMPTGSGPQPGLDLPTGPRLDHHMESDQPRSPLRRPGPTNPPEEAPAWPKEP